MYLSLSLTIEICVSFHVLGISSFSIWFSEMSLGSNSNVEQFLRFIVFINMFFETFVLFYIIFVVCTAMQEFANS